jgi:hypothetical protein
MCPACIGSAALLLLSGAGSAGGVAALTFRSIVRRRTPLPVSSGQHVAGKGLEDRVRAIAGIELAEQVRLDPSLPGRTVPRPFAQRAVQTIDQGVDFPAVAL